MLDGVYQNPAQSISQRLMVGGFANRQAYLRYTRSEDDSEREKERERPKKKSE